MKIQQWALAGLLFCGLLAPRAFAGNPAGTWKGTIDLQGQNVQVILHLSVDGAKLTGKVERENAPASELSEGKVEGDTIRFSIQAEYDGGTYPVQFHGKLKDDVLEGSLSTPDSSWVSPVKLQRDISKAAVDVSGTWKGSFDFQGTPVALVIKLQTVNGVIQGTVEGLPTTPATITNARLSGKELSFKVNTDYEGQTHTLQFLGTCALDKIIFTLGTEDDAWDATLQAVKAD
ncbi:MAG: hypothetical protein P4K83_01325 [Terracidiphilus sp.]|nr:hypothetical protein [Terracidiphilus sp.]